METRKNQRSRPAQHEALCSVCKHLQRQEIERGYLSFETGAKLARQFGLSESAITRHAQFFNLDAERASNTEKVLKNIIGRGFSQVKKVDARLLMEAIKELNKITGKHQAARQNEDDVRREEDNRRWAEEKLREIQTDFGLSRAEAVELARQHAPSVLQWIN